MILIIVAVLGISYTVFPIDTTNMGTPDKTESRAANTPGVSAVNRLAYSSAKPYQEASNTDIAFAPDRAQATATVSQEKNEKKLDCAYIAFTFDDGGVSDYELAYKILKKYGIKGTSYIIAKYADVSKPNFLTWDQIREMYNDGWVFGCHTYVHSKLDRLTTEEIKESMEKVNASFIAQGLPAPEIGAYPYGRYDEHVIEAVKPYRIQMRKAYYESKLVDINDISPYEIDSVSADMRTEKRLKLHEKIVDKACREKGVIVFRCHCLYREKLNDMGKRTVQTDSALFEELVKYCVDKGCKFITMTDLIKLYS